MKKTNNMMNLMAEISRTAIIKKTIPVDLSVYTTASMRALEKALEAVNKNYVPEERALLERANDALKVTINNLKFRQACRQVELKKLCRKLALAGVGEEIVMFVVGKKFTCVDQVIVDELIFIARRLLKENNILEEEAKESASQKAAKAAINAAYAELLSKEESNLVKNEGLLIKGAKESIGDDIVGKAALLIFNTGNMPNSSCEKASKEMKTWAAQYLRDRGLLSKAYIGLDGFGLNRLITGLGEYAEKDGKLGRRKLTEEDLAEREELISKIFADKMSDNVLAKVCNYNYMVKDGHVVIGFEKAEGIRDTVIRGKEKTDLLNKLWFAQAAYEGGYNVGDPYIVLRQALRVLMDDEQIIRHEEAKSVIADYLSKADIDQAWAAFKASRAVWVAPEILNLGFDVENEEALEEALKAAISLKMNQNNKFWLIEKLKKYPELFRNVPDDFGGRRNDLSEKFEDPALQYWKGNKAAMEAMESEYLDNVKVGYDVANWSFCFARALMFANIVDNEGFEEFEYSKKLQGMTKPILAKYKALFSGRRVLCKATKADVLDFYEDIRNAFARNWVELSPDQQFLAKALSDSVIPTIMNCTDNTNCITYKWTRVDKSKISHLKSFGYEVRENSILKKNGTKTSVSFKWNNDLKEVERVEKKVSNYIRETYFEVKVVDHIESDLDLMVDGIYTIYYWLTVSPERWRNCKSVAKVLETGLMYGPAREDYKNDKDNDFGCYFLSLTRDDGSERDIAAVDLYGNPISAEEFDNCF